MQNTPLKKTLLSSLIIGALTAFYLTACEESTEIIPSKIPLVEYTPCLQSLTADCTYEALLTIGAPEHALAFQNKFKAGANSFELKADVPTETIFKLYNIAIRNQALLMASHSDDIEGLDEAFSLLKSIYYPNTQNFDAFLKKKELVADIINHHQKPDLVKDDSKSRLYHEDGYKKPMTSWVAMDVLPFISGLVKSGLLDDAYELAGELPAIYKAYGYQEIGHAYLDAGNESEAATIFSEAAAALVSTPGTKSEFYQRQAGYVSYEVASALAYVGDKRGVEKMVAYQTKPEHQAETLSALAGTLIKQGKKEEALQYVAASKKLASGIKVRKNEEGAEAKVKTIQNIALAEATQGKYDLAKYLSKEIETINAYPPQRGSGMTGFLMIDIFAMIYRAYAPERIESYTNHYNYALTLLDIANLESEAGLKEDAEKTTDLATAVLRKMEGKYSHQASGFAAAAAMYGRMGNDKKQASNFGLAKRIIGNLSDPYKALQKYAEVFSIQYLLEDEIGMKMTLKEMKDTLSNAFAVQQSPFADQQKPSYFYGLTVLLNHLTNLYEMESDKPTQGFYKQALQSLIDTYFNETTPNGETLAQLKNKQSGATSLDLYIVRTLLILDQAQKAIEYVDTLSIKTNNMNANNDLSLAAKEAAFSEIAYSAANLGNKK